LINIDLSILTRLEQIELLGLLCLLEEGFEGEGAEEVALTLVELGLELHPVKPAHHRGL